MSVSDPPEELMMAADLGSFLLFFFFFFFSGVFSGVVSEEDELELSLEELDERSLFRANAADALAAAFLSGGGSAGAVDAGTGGGGGAPARAELADWALPDGT